MAAMVAAPRLVRLAPGHGDAPPPTRLRYLDRGRRRRRRCRRSTERLALAERTMTALVADAELPPKIGVHPRPDGSFAHAMPALSCADADPHGADDLLGIKWVAGFARPTASRGLPAINASLILNDPTTGVPVAILDGGADHGAADRRGLRRRHRAVRAAASAARRRRGPRSSGRASRATATCRSSGTCCPGVALVDPRPAPGAGRRDSRTTAERTAGSAAVRVAPIGPRRGRRRRRRRHRCLVPAPAERQAMTDDWLAPDALVVAVDYATHWSRPRSPGRGAVPRRRSRAVPGQPRRRPVRRLPGPDRDARRGDPRGHRRGRRRAGSW